MILFYFIVLYCIDSPISYSSPDLSKLARIIKFSLSEVKQCIVINLLSPISAKLYS